jgi:hypothetical protein
MKMCMKTAFFGGPVFIQAMILYENVGSFVINGLSGQFHTVSYSFLQPEHIYENMKLPIGHFIFHIHRKIIR